jgi:type IV secretory pathway ATPase VirB11/archaellum biosynthesis ATPase
LHADSGAETINRLTNPPLNVPPNLLKAVNLNVIMFRDRRRGIRRILQVAEFEVEGNNAEANIIYRF